MLVRVFTPSVLKLPAQNQKSVQRCRFTRSNETALIINESKSFKYEKHTRLLAATVFFFEKERNVARLTKNLNRSLGSFFVIEPPESRLGLKSASYLFTNYNIAAAATTGSDCLRLTF